MKRIACLGNSHLAAFKLGWDEIKPAYEDIDITFFGASASGMRHLEVSGTKIVPTTPSTREQIINTSGLEEISNDYDAYILVGMGMGVVHMVNMLAKHRPPHLYSPSSGHHLISDGIVSEVRRHLVDGSASVSNSRRIRQINQTAPVFVAPNPVPTTDILKNEDFPSWTNEAVLADCQAYLDDTIAKYFQTVTYVDQPPETKASRYLTKPDFTRNTLVIKGTGTKQAKEGDVWHMNAVYGGVFLSTILSMVRERFAEQADTGRYAVSP